SVPLSFLLDAKRTLRNVNKGRVRRVQSHLAACVRLDLPYSVSVDDLDVRYAVGHGLAVNLVEAGGLVVVEGDDELPALLISDLVIRAERLEQTDAPTAQRGVE